MTGTRLKERREKMGYSQQELARLLDVALSTVARWEQLKDEKIPNSKILELALNQLRQSERKKK